MTRAEERAIALVERMRHIVDFPNELSELIVRGLIVDELKDYCKSLSETLSSKETNEQIQQ